jgi:hypothetical protein
MSAIRDALTGLLSGGFGGGSALLHSCRMDGAGVRVYGRESILDLFRAHHPSIEFIQVLQTERSAALFAQEPRGPIALVGDLHRDHLVRLWYLAPTALPLEGLARVDVPFDSGFGQLTPAIAFDPPVHLELSPTHAVRVTTAISQLFLPEGAPQAIPSRLANRVNRMRPHVLRAFSQGDSAVVLMMVTAHRNDGNAGVVQFSVAVRLASDTPEEAAVVVDEGGLEREIQRIWKPVF